MEEPIDPVSDLTCPSRAKDWRSLLRCVRHQDAAPSAGAASLCRQVQLALAAAAEGHDEARVALFLRILLRRLLRLLSLGGEDCSADLAAAVILFCRAVGVAPGPRVVLPDTALLAEIAPRVPGSMEFEPVVEALLGEVEEAKLRLGVEVMAGEDGASGLTFLQWLQQLSRWLSTNSLPVPVTESAVSCFRSLLSISPSSLEAVVGRVAAVIVYNVDKVDPLPFWTDLTNTHVKLRQVPKLLARILISAASCEDLSVRPLALELLAPFCAAVRGLSLAQCADLWKTFLYHAGTSSDRPSVRVILEDFFPLLLMHSPIVDHTVPKPTLDKFLGLLRDTREVAAGLPAVAEAADRLGLVLQRYRDVESLSDVPKNLLLEVAMLRNDVKGIGKIVKDFKVDSETPPVNLNMVSHYLSSKQVMSLTCGLVSKTGLDLDKSGWLRSEAFLESPRLQRGVVVNMLVHMADVFDVDSTCEEVMKQFAKRSDELFDLAESKLEAKLGKSFNSLSSALLSDPTNPDLDPKFYFRGITDLLEAMPLEALEGNMNLSTCLITLTLLAVSTHEEVNDRLLKILARCVDPTWRQSHLLRHIDASKLLTWMSRLRSTEMHFLEYVLSALTSNLVKYVRDYDRTRPGLTGALGLLAESTLTFSSELGNARQSLPSVFLLEALVAPLAHGDASDEKLKICSNLADSISQHVKNGLSQAGCFKSNPDSEMPRLALRCLAALTQMWNSLGDSKSKTWKGIFSGAFDYALKTENKESESFLSAILDSGGLECLPKNFALRIWKERVLRHPDRAQGLMTKTLGSLGEGDLSAILEDALKLPLEYTWRHDPAAVDANFRFSVNLCESLVALGEKSLGDAAKTHLESALPRLRAAAAHCLGQVPRVSEPALAMMALERSLLRTEKPLLSRANESLCIETALNVNLVEVVTEDGFETFHQLWRAIYEVASAAFLRRLHSLALAQVPNVLNLFRILSSGLAEAAAVDPRTGDSVHNLSPEQINEAVLCATDFDRLVEHIRRHQTEFGRSSSYLVGDLTQSLLRARAVHPGVRSAAAHAALAKLLDTCDAHSVSFLTSALTSADEATGVVFSKVLEDYKQHRKYKGKV